MLRRSGTGEVMRTDFRPNGQPPVVRAPRAPAIAALRRPRECIASPAPLRQLAPPKIPSKRDERAMNHGCIGPAVPPPISALKTRHPIFAAVVRTPSLPRPDFFA